MNPGWAREGVLVAAREETGTYQGAASESNKTGVTLVLTEAAHGPKLAQIRCI